jgi:hypothetical protein
MRAFGPAAGRRLGNFVRAHRPQPVKYQRIHFNGWAIVVAFDMCSSSNIIEQLTLLGDLRPLNDVLTSVKRHLAAAQKLTPFDPYKFTGDGWILLFPTTTSGVALLTLLQGLCLHFREQMRKRILPLLENPPSIIGLSVGIDKGALVPIQMYGQREYVGRTLNIACRLQSAVKDKGGSPAYKALVSNVVFREHLSKVPNLRAQSVSRVLRNINGGAPFRCKKIDLLSVNNAP